jgi:hypothetical protein
MPWFRISVYTDNTIILYFLCLTTKILLYYYRRNFSNGQSDFLNMLILKKLGGWHPLNTLPRYGPGGGKKNKCNHKGHLKHFSRKCCENVGINQRPLRQKCNLNNIFHEHKGHFATEKRALLKTWVGLGPPAPPPGSYAPVCEWESTTLSSYTLSPYHPNSPRALHKCHAKDSLGWYNANIIHWAHV